MKALRITRNNFKEEVLSSPIPVVIDLWAEWCAPCKMLEPIIEDAAEDFEGQIKVGKVDVDADPEIADEYKVMSIPTVLVFHGGKEIGRIVGYSPKREFYKRLERILAAVKPA
ncbi:MAG: thioredoxin [bacterium JZ-2024 1]